MMKLQQASVLFPRFCNDDKIKAFPVRTIGEHDSDSFYFLAKMKFCDIIKFQKEITY